MSGARSLAAAVAARVGAPAEAVALEEGGSWHATVFAGCPVVFRAEAWGATRAQAEALVAAGCASVAEARLEALTRACRAIEGADPDGLDRVTVEAMRAASERLGFDLRYEEEKFFVYGLGRRLVDVPKMRGDRQPPASYKAVWAVDVARIVGNLTRYEVLALAFAACDGRTNDTPAGLEQRGQLAELRSLVGVR